jgi:hypothetical protein
MNMLISPKYFGRTTISSRPVHHKKSGSARNDDGSSLLMQAKFTSFRNQSKLVNLEDAFQQIGLMLLTV